EDFREHRDRCDRDNNTHEDRERERVPVEPRVRGEIVDVGNEHSNNERNNSCANQKRGSDFTILSRKRPLDLESRYEHQKNKAEVGNQGNQRALRKQSAKNPVISIRSYIPM